METIKIVEREIQQKWTVKMQEHSAIHSAGLLLAPGNWKMFDPFLLMAEDIMKKGAFDHHPHRGIETVTYIIDGELNHFDNNGGKGTLRKGDTQWMTAGSGILHLEEAAQEGSVHTLQLWVNLPAADKMTTPGYQDIAHATMPVIKNDGAEIRIISGSVGDAQSSTKNIVPVLMVEINLQSGHGTKLELPQDYNGFIYVLSGSGIFGKNDMEGKEKEVLWLSPSENDISEISMRAIEDIKLLVIAGKPLREPVVAKGPFVMNTEAQITEAYKDFRSGKFGNWNQ